MEIALAGGEPVGVANRHLHTPPESALEVVDRLVETVTARYAEDEDIDVPDRQGALDPVAPWCTGCPGAAREQVGYHVPMAATREVEFVFEPDADGGYHVYAPDLPGLHTQGASIEDATANAREALELYVEGLRDDGLELPEGIVRRTLPLPA